VNVEGDTDGNGVADFNIQVDGVASLMVADFILRATMGSSLEWLSLQFAGFAFDDFVPAPTANGHHRSCAK
jgi:hypothetical protein